MGGNDADCGSSWQTRVRASLRNKRLHEEHYQFRHLDPLYPFYLDRGSSIVTKEVLCRADPDVQNSSIRFLISCRYQRGPGRFGNRVGVSMYLARFPTTVHETMPPSLPRVPQVGSPASTVL